MPPALLDTLLVALILFMTYVLTSEGAWGAALMFFNVVFGGMIAFNFFEPLADVIDSTGVGFIMSFSEPVAIMLIFCASTLLLRLATESLGPAMVRFPTPVFHLVRLVFGFGATIVTFAVILLAFHASPVHKKMFGYIEYDTKPPFGFGIDHGWLGFFQATTGDVFARYGAGARDPYSTYGKTGNQLMRVNLFDPRGKWLLDKQEARPYGEGPILEDGGGEAPAGGGEGGGAPAMAPPGGATGSRPIGGPVAPTAGY